MCAMVSPFVAPTLDAIQQANISCPDNSRPLLTSLPPRTWLCIRGAANKQSFFDTILTEFGFWLDCERMVHIAVALGVLDLSYSFRGSESLIKRRDLLSKHRMPPRRTGPRSSPVLLDIGAHAGTCAVRFASLGVPVVAVEPHPVSAQRLRSSMRLNGLDGSNVSIIEAAVQEAAAEGAALYSSMEDEDVAYTGHVRFNVTARGELLVRYVPVTTLADILKQHRLLQRSRLQRHAQHSILSNYSGLKSHRALGIVKIDVEGAEFEVLRSSMVPGTRHSLLADVASVLFVDLHPESLIARGSGVMEVYAWLNYQGFWVVHIGGTANVFVAVHERVWPASFEDLSQLISDATLSVNNLKAFMSHHVAQKATMKSHLHVLSLLNVPCALVFHGSLLMCNHGQ